MSNPTPHICVVGSANMDLIARVPRMPRLGETLQGRSFHLVYGGKGANQAVMAAKMGAQVTMVARVGHDVFGEGMRRNFQSLGIDTTHVYTDDAQTSGVAPIFVDDNAQNVIVIVSGANGALSPDDVRAARDSILASQAVICQLEVPIETTLEAFRIAKTAGVKTILNPAPAAALPEELLALSDIAAPNETETEFLTGLPVHSLDDAKIAGRELLNKGLHTVLITMGEHGVLYMDTESTVHVSAMHVDAVDPTGAGDAFIGSLAVYLAEGLPMHEAVWQANAVAALSVTRIGAQISFPMRAEVNAFIAARRD